MDFTAAIRTLRNQPYGLSFDDARFLADYARATPGDVAIWSVQGSGRPLDRILVRYRAGTNSFSVARCAGAGTPVL